MSVSPATAGERGAPEMRGVCVVCECPIYYSQEWFYASDSSRGRHASTDGCSLAAELTRLRAENERLRECVRAGDVAMDGYIAAALSGRGIDSELRALSIEKRRAYDKARAGLEVK